MKDIPFKRQCRKEYWTSMVDHVLRICTKIKGHKGKCRENEVKVWKGNGRGVKTGHKYHKWLLTGTVWDRGGRVETDGRWRR